MAGISKKIVILLLVCFIGAFVAGCSGQKQAATTSSSGQQNDEQVYTVATEASFAPFEMRNSKGNFEGFDIDLINAIAKVENMKIKIKDMGFDGIIAALQTGNVDLAISGISITPDRQKAIDFSLPYMQAGLMIAVKSDDNTIHSFKDLEGKTIACQIGTTGADYCDKIKGAKVVKFDHVPDAFMEVQNGRAVAVVNDRPVSAYYIGKSNGAFKFTGELLNSEFYGIGIPKNKPELKQKINDGLKKLKENGEYAKIYRKWFKEDPPEFLPGEPAQK